MKTLKVSHIPELEMVPWTPHVKSVHTNSPFKDSLSCKISVFLNSHHALTIMQYIFLFSSSLGLTPTGPDLILPIKFIGTIFFGLLSLM